MEGWEKEMTNYMGVLGRSYLEMKNTKAKDPNIDARALATNRFHLGLFEWWQGKEDTARELFAEAAATTLSLVERLLPDLPLDHATSYAEPAELGAMAAALAGQEQVAKKLFAHAELFATGLVTNDESTPESALDALDKPNAILPYIRSYSLIRLGRLSGFKAFIHTVPLADAREATPVWTRTDIHHALDTANVCFELWRSRRGGLDPLKKKKFEPLLRALVACLAPSAREPERLAARKALHAYQNAIRDLANFMNIYPRVLDLQAAYPHILG